MELLVFSWILKCNVEDFLLPQSLSTWLGALATVFSCRSMRTSNFLTLLNWIDLMSADSSVYYIHLLVCVYPVPSNSWTIMTTRVPFFAYVGWFRKLCVCYLASLLLNYYYYCHYCHLPSVLWRCWLGGRKGIRPVKNWVVRCWRGYLSGVRCRFAYAHLMPLPLTVCCFSKIQIGFTFLVPAHPGCPGKRAVKRVCVLLSLLCIRF